MKILLADDHTLVRATLADVLSRLEGDVTVDEAGNFQEIDALLEANDEYDLIIVDLVMPGMVGVEGVAALCDRCADTPVVVLSGIAEQAKIRAAMDVGARGFIPKTISPRGMINALRLVLAGDVYVPELMLSETAPPARPNEVDTGGVKLTPREADVMRLLVKGHRNKIIARELGIEEVTVKVHTYHIFQKLGVSNRSEAIVESLRLGLTTTH